MKTLTQADFDPLLNDEFTVELGEGLRLRLQLTEVNPGTERIRSQYEPGERAPFSLVFRGPSDSLFPQGLYTLMHATLGPHDTFLVPIGPDKEGMCYEAVFA